MNEILSEILRHIRLVHDDKQKLQKILDFILKEIYEEEEEEQLEIPQKFEALINPIAQSIDGGQIVYINLDTMQTEDVSPNMEDPEEFEMEYGDSEWAAEPEFYKWENTLRIAPLESNESFRIMEAFAENMNDVKFREQLFYTLDYNKCFANFKWKINRILFFIADLLCWFNNFRINLYLLFHDPKYRALKVQYIRPVLIFPVLNLQLIAEHFQLFDLQESEFLNQQKPE